jgi:hypothetical protein
MCPASKKDSSAGTLSVISRSKSIARSLVVIAASPAPGL